MSFSCCEGGFCLILNNDEGVPDSAIGLSNLSLFRFKIIMVCQDVSQIAQKKHDFCVYIIYHNNTQRYVPSLLNCGTMGRFFFYVMAEDQSGESCNSKVLGVRHIAKCDGFLLWMLLGWLGT